MLKMMLLLLVTSFFFLEAYGKRFVADTDLGLLPNHNDIEVATLNTNLLNNAFKSIVGDNDEVVFPKDQIYYMQGGVKVDRIFNLSITLDSEIVFTDQIENWPSTEGTVDECFLFTKTDELTIKSSKRGQGKLFGNGKAWWGFPGIGYLMHVENRPRLLQIRDSDTVVIENISMVNSPYWTAFFNKTNNVVVRYCDVVAKRSLLSSEETSHSLFDLSAFNTDGFDFNGRNVHVHNCSIYTQDDSIAVKGSSSDMLFENIEASGTGFTVGSVSPSDFVRNITFRNCFLKDTFKGVYLKFNDNIHDNDHEEYGVKDILYENIVMDGVEQWAIWIGPAQQSDHPNLCFANPCSICWPFIPLSKCTGVDGGHFTNVVMSNISVFSPKLSPGVIMASKGSKMKRVLFDNVVVEPNRRSSDNLNAFATLVPLIKRDFELNGSDGLAASFYIAATTAAAGFFYCIVKFGILGFFYAWLISSNVTTLSVVLGSWLVLYLILSRMYRKTFENQQEYYACENVVDGVATGRTFPVPQCFVDETIGENIGYSTSYNRLGEIDLHILLSLGNFMWLLSEINWYVQVKDRSGRKYKSTKTRYGGRLWTSVKILIVCQVVIALKDDINLIFRLIR